MIVLRNLFLILTVAAMSGYVSWVFVTGVVDLLVALLGGAS